VVFIALSMQWSKPIDCHWILLWFLQFDILMFLIQISLLCSPLYRIKI
jgi:hypothetical protein